jgi:hypothetical protein
MVISQWLMLDTAPPCHPPPVAQAVPVVVQVLLVLEEVMVL